MYCRGCEEQGLACATGGIGLTGDRCPYLEHAPDALEEHQAWDIVRAMQNHIRVGPTGQLLGLDLGLALELARARGHDPEVTSELLPASEAGILEACNDHTH